MSVGPIAVISLQRIARLRRRFWRAFCKCYRSRRRRVIRRRRIKTWSIQCTNPIFWIIQSGCEVNFLSLCKNPNLPQIIPGSSWEAGSRWPPPAPCSPCRRARWWSPWRCSTWWTQWRRILNQDQVYRDCHESWWPAPSFWHFGMDTCGSI